MNISIDLPIERNEIEIEVQCNLVLHPASRGARDTLCGVRGAGPALEPDEPAEMEFIKATNSDGKEIDLTDDEIDKAKDKAWNSID